MKRLALPVMVVVALGLPTGAAAATIHLTAEFTSVMTWMLPPAVRPAKVNGVALTPNGDVPIGSIGSQQFFLSTQILLEAGTTAVNFQYDNPPNLLNRMEFTPNPGPIEVNLFQEFLAGTFLFVNGQWFPHAFLGFRATTHSADPAFDGHTFTGVIGIDSVSTDGSDPEAEADSFFLLGLPGMQTCRVYDLAFQPVTNPGHIGACNFYATIGSLIPTRFEAANAATFISPFITPDPDQTIPEPAMLLLFAGAATVLRRRLLQRRAGHTPRTSLGPVR